MEAIKGKISADNWQTRGKSEQKVKDQQKCQFLIYCFSKIFNFEQYIFKLLVFVLYNTDFRIVLSLIRGGMMNLPVFNYIFHN